MEYDNNIIAAFANEPKLFDQKVDNYSIPIIGIVDNISFSENILHALGIWQPISQKLKRLLGKNR